MSDLEDVAIQELIERSIDGSITPRQTILLEEMIVSDPAASRYYCQYMELSIGLNLCATGISPVDFLELDNTVKKAPVETHRITVKRNYWRSAFATFIAAAMLLFAVLLTNLIYQKHNSVARVADSLDAVWSSSSGYYRPGKYLKTDDGQMKLIGGYARLAFNNGADVLIEAPAQFQIVSELSIRLWQGRVYSVVPQSASGFTVLTDNAEIIDIGTEFGVQVDGVNDTDLYVFKGKTSLVVNNSEQKASEVDAGMARKIAGSNGRVSEIEFKNNIFVREINSDNEMVWRGQKRIALADILGGGNGFGEGRNEQGFDPINGNRSDGMLFTRKSGNDYWPIKQNPYIDGVFVPNGRSKQVVSTQGDIFSDCPPTSGMCFNRIFNSYRDVDLAVDGGIDTIQSQCILMHANTGLTFDLGAIRKIKPGMKVIAFEAKCGIEKNTSRPKSCNADFWVLVDGKVRYSRKNVKDLNTHPISFQLNENDRFLTLVTTDGGDPEVRSSRGIKLSAIDSDWGMFVEPVLVTGED